MKNKIIISIILAFTFLKLAPVFAAGVLRVHPTNPRYFTDDSGKAIYLTGSHTRDSLVDKGNSYPPVAFDFNSYINFLKSNNHNFIRLWTWELFQQYSGGNMSYSLPKPWPRTGPGSALDGKLKFDLNKFDYDYFERLYNRVNQAKNNGIYVSVMLFEGWGLQYTDVSWRWNGHPFNIKNNINGVNGDPNEDRSGLESHTLEIPAIKNIEEMYVRKVIDTVNDLDNVLYEISNEDHSGSKEWQYYMVKFIHDYENTKPKQHPVGLTTHSEMGNPFVFESEAEWVSPTVFVWGDENDPYKTNPPLATGSKIILLDTDHLWGEGGDRIWIWKSFARGYNPIYMDNTDIAIPKPEQLSARPAMGHTLTYAKKMDLAKMAPSNSSSDCSTTYCLRNPGKEYLVYQPGTGAFSVNLSAGSYNYEWFNPATGQVSSTGSSTVSAGNKSFTPPFSGDSVLYLKSSASSVPTVPAGLSVR